MKKGSGAGGCGDRPGRLFRDLRPTTHDEPTFVVDGVVHYCVANMPGAAPLTSTYALTAATLPFVLKMADMGVAAALAADPHLRNGLNVRGGAIVHPAVLAALQN